MLLFLLFTLIILIFARKRLFRIEEGMFMRFHILLALLIGRHSLYHKEHDKGDHKQQYRYYHIDLQNQNETKQYERYSHKRNANPSQCSSQSFILRYSLLRF